MNYNILIEPIINKKTHGFAVQSKKFSFDLKITNNSKTPSKEFTISKIAIASAQGQDVQEDFGGRSFHVGIINPDDSLVIRIGETGQFMYGLVNIKLSVTNNSPDNTIAFSQRNPFTKEITEIGKNQWVDFIYIKSSNEDLQEKTNFALIILTIVIAIPELIIIFKTLYHYFPGLRL